MTIKDNKLEEKRHRRDIDAVMKKVFWEIKSFVKIKDGVIKDENPEKGYPTYWL